MKQNIKLFLKWFFNFLIKNFDFRERIVGTGRTQQSCLPVCVWDFHSGMCVCLCVISSVIDLLTFLPPLDYATTISLWY